MKSMTLFMTGGIVLNSVGPRGLDRQVLAIAPFLPGPGVVPHPRIPEQAKREIPMRGAITALAIGDDFLVGRDAGLLIHRRELLGGLERPVFTEVVGPLDMHRAGNAAAALRADHRPIPFA